jgi:predicted esterase
MNNLHLSAVFRCFLLIFLELLNPIVYASTNVNTLIEEIPLTQTNWTASELNTQWVPTLPDEQATLIGSPLCGIHLIKLRYATHGVAFEPTTATLALMLPTGNSITCQNTSKAILFAHGTMIDKRLDLANLTPPHDAGKKITIRVGLIFAAQGYLTILPNYSGYDSSPLPYTPYLDAAQNGQEMIDALRAVDQWLTLNHKPSLHQNKLYLTGYSQGGFVALATIQKLQEIHWPIQAGAVSSGPYALLAVGDEVMMGHPTYGATVYMSLLSNSLAHLPNHPIDMSSIFSPEYQDAPGLFPGPYDKAGFLQLVKQNKFPLLAMFQSSPTGYANLDNRPLPFISFLGFDSRHYLVKTSFRENYISDLLQNPDSAAPASGAPPDLDTRPPLVAKNPGFIMRQLLKESDLRSVIPKSPLFICGGDRDPEVFWDQGAGTLTAMLFSNSTQSPQLQFATLDLDTQGEPGQLLSYGLTDDQRTQLTKTTTEAQKGFVHTQYPYSLDKLIFLLGVRSYHENLEAYCLISSRAFFKLFP